MLPRGTKDPDRVPTVWSTPFFFIYCNATTGHPCCIKPDQVRRLEIPAFHTQESWINTRDMPPRVEVQTGRTNELAALSAPISAGRTCNLSLEFYCIRPPLCKGQIRIEIVLLPSIQSSTPTQLSSQVSQHRQKPSVFTGIFRQRDLI